MIQLLTFAGNHRAGKFVREIDTGVEPGDGGHDRQGQADRHLDIGCLAGLRLRCSRRRQAARRAFGCRGIPALWVPGVVPFAHRWNRVDLWIGVAGAANVFDRRSHTYLVMVGAVATHVAYGEFVLASIPLCLLFMLGTAAWVRRGNSGLAGAND
jgi:hypothetical protein